MSKPMIEIKEDNTIWINPKAKIEEEDGVYYVSMYGREISFAKGGALDFTRDGKPQHVAMYTLVGKELTQRLAETQKPTKRKRER